MAKTRRTQLTYDELVRARQAEKAAKAADKAARAKRRAKNAKARERYHQAHDPIVPAPEASGRPLPPFPEPGEVVLVDMRDWAIWKEAHGVRDVSVAHKMRQVKDPYAPGGTRMAYVDTIVTVSRDEQEAIHERSEPEDTDDFSVQQALDR